MTAARLSEEGAIGRVARWWWSEMRAMLPRGERGRPPPLLAERDGEALLVRRAGRRRGGRVLARLGENDGEAAGKGARGGRGKVALRLGEDAVIRRELMLPVAAERHLASALALRAELETPFRAEDCLVGGRVLGRERRELRVEMAVAARAEVATLSGRLARAGFEVALVETPGRGGPIALEADPTGAAAGRGGRDRLALLLLLLCLGLALAAATRPFLRLSAERAMIAERIAALEPAATRAEEALAELERREARRAAFAALEAEPQAVAAVAAVAEALPDGAWLEELRLEDRRLALSGFADRAAALPGALERHPRLEGAAFDAPVTLAPGGRHERFEISVGIAEVAP